MQALLTDVRAGARRRAARRTDGNLRPWSPRGSLPLRGAPQPTTEVDPLNVDGNTPLHVACACRRSAAVKMLLRAGERVHSVHVPNNKGKLPIDYVKKAKDAASREIYGYLLGTTGGAPRGRAAAEPVPDGEHRAAHPTPRATEYEQKIRDVYSLPSDTDVLRKYILDLLLDVDEFRDRCKARRAGRSAQRLRCDSAAHGPPNAAPSPWACPQDTIYHLVQVKQSALRTASPEVGAGAPPAATRWLFRTGSLTQLAHAPPPIAPPRIDP